MKRMIAVRGAHEAFAGGRLIPFHAKNASVLGYQRPTPRGPILVLANFGEAPQPVAPEVLAAMPGEAVDLLSGVRHALRQGLLLGPYQQLWLDCRGAPA
jgi:amylosucrase